MKTCISAGLIAAAFSIPAIADLPLHGETLLYPRSVTKDRLLSEVNGFTCGKTKTGEDECRTTIRPGQELLIRGFTPPLCSMGGTAEVTFKSGRAYRVICDIDLKAWDYLFEFFKSKLGEPKDLQFVRPTISYGLYEWKDGDDYISLFIKMTQSKKNGLTPERIEIWMGSEPVLIKAWKGS